MVCTSTNLRLFKSISTPARRNSSASKGISKRLELYPARSHPSIWVASDLAISLKVGQSFTSSSVMPCIAVDSGGMGISGLIRLVLDSSFPFGKTLTKEISTIRSFTILIPVVSRSKKTNGFFRFNCIFYILIIQHHRHQQHQQIFVLFIFRRNDQTGTRRISQFEYHLFRVDVAQYFNQISGLETDA